MHEITYELFRPTFERLHDEYTTITRARRAAQASPEPLTWTEYLGRLDWFLTYFGREQNL